MYTKKEIIEILITYHGYSKEEAEKRYKVLSEEKKKTLIEFRDNKVKYKD